MSKAIITLFFAVFIASCSRQNNLPDAYGNFESLEYMISPEVQGRLVNLKIREGDMVEKGTEVGLIDSTRLHLEAEQLRAGKRAAESGYLQISAEIGVYEEKKENLIREKNRTENMLRDSAATGKQMDEIMGNLRVVEKQIDVVRTKYAALAGEIESLEKQIARVEDMISRCTVINPVTGSVMEKYAEPHEIVQPGRTLYKVANLDTLILRAYISGGQLAGVRTGQKVRVMFDVSREERASLEGVVAWISEEAEFTPMVIQTREDRVDLVYAMKVRVINDGRLKIGMPGEVFFEKNGD